MDKKQQMYGHNNRRYRQQHYRNSNSPSRVNPSCGCKQGDHTDKCVDKVIDKCVNDLPLAMAYVPMQRWENVCDAQSGLVLGCIFKDLVKPYCPVLQRRGDR